MLIYNAASPGEGVPLPAPVELDMRHVMQVFISQLRMLIGINTQVSATAVCVCVCVCVCGSCVCVCVCAHEKLVVETSAVFGDLRCDNETCQISERCVFVLQTSTKEAHISQPGNAGVTEWVSSSLECVFATLLCKAV